MRILAHRGHWLNPKEKNSRGALCRAFDHPFGVETDIRDSGGRLVISHDKPTGTEMSFEDFLALFPRNLDPERVPLALNIKADGLASDIQRLMSGRPPKSWFVFDMSVPDMLSYIKAGLPVFTRVSDYEAEPVAYDYAAGLWVDGFAEDWLDFDRLHRYLDDGKMIALVSPELHGRPKDEFWQWIRAGKLHRHQGVFICTDLPVEAEAFFA